MELGVARKWVMTLCFGLSAAVVSADQPLPSVDDKIQLVTFSDPPYIIGDEGPVEGLVVRYVNHLMKQAGTDFDLTVLPAKRAILHTLATPNSCVFPIERSQEREVQFEWVSPILISRHGFYRAVESSSRSIDVLNDVRNLSIGSYLGSGIGEYLRSLGFRVEYAAENEANLSKLIAGRIDLWASDDLSATYIAMRSGKVLPEPELLFFTSLRAIGCHRSVSDTVVDLWRSELQKMYRDGTIQSIRDAYIEQEMMSMF